MTITELEELLDYAEKMQNGIDPTTDIYFKEDTVLQSTKIKSYNAKVATLIKEVIHVCGGTNTTFGSSGENRSTGGKRKIPFSLSEDKIRHYEYSTEQISISALTYQLNSLCAPYMKKIRPTEITTWLQKKGYLETIYTKEGLIYKVATQEGKRLGISNENRINKYGNAYSVNLYNIEAQRFVIEHINEIGTCN